MKFLGLKKKATNFLLSITATDGKFLNQKIREKTTF